MDSDSYWLGVASALAFIQADHDVEANKDKDPWIEVRLPFIIDAQPEDLERFDRAVNELNDEANILWWRLVKTDDYGEHTIQFISTEGYQGLRLDCHMQPDPGWR